MYLALHTCGTHADIQANTHTQTEIKILKIVKDKDLSIIVVLFGLPTAYQTDIVIFFVYLGLERFFMVLFCLFICLFFLRQGLVLFEMASHLLVKYQTFKVILSYLGSSRLAYDI